MRVADRVRRLDRRRRDLSRCRARGSDDTTPTFWGRYERVVVTSGLSKAFAMPGLRVGWAVAPPDTIGRIWERHDYTTLTPGMVSDRLAARAMLPDSARPDPGAYPLDRPRQLPAAGVVAGQPCRHLRMGASDRRRDRLRQGQAARLDDRPGRADPHRAERAAGVGRDVRHRQRDPVRLRLRHRAHPQGPVEGRRPAH